MMHARMPLATHRDDALNVQAARHLRLCVAYAFGGRLRQVAAWCSPRPSCQPRPCPLGLALGSGDRKQFGGKRPGQSFDVPPICDPAAAASALRSGEAVLCSGSSRSISCSNSKQVAAVSSRNAFRGSPSIRHDARSRMHPSTPAHHRQSEPGPNFAHHARSSLRRRAARLHCFTVTLLLYWL
jgi:hypothetical protein